jgi:arginine repressor
MPLVAKDRQQFYISRIRALVSLNHQATHVELLEKLKAEGITLDREYLSKLVGKVYRERIKRADHQTLNYALAAFEDTMTEVGRGQWNDG